jgi:nicotinamidase-related amidase
MKIELLIIDPQNDFCDPKGSLFVPGADKDMQRLAAFIQRTKRKLDDIHVTLDSHHYFDIAHPIFFVDSKGKQPNPFTIISVQDVEGGVWRAAVPQYQGALVNYVKSLAANGRYPLCVWPPHCLIGSWGYGIYPDVFNSLIEWEKDLNIVDKITKGSNFLTEHYSAVQADVPDAGDPDTMLNQKLCQTLARADLILLSGEALSHCLANTVRDIANNFGEENIKKMVLLRDATSPVPNPPGNIPDFVKMGEDFIREMQGRGMQVSTTTEFLK